MIGVHLMFASFLTTLVGCLPFSKEDLKPLPVEEYIKEVYQSVINGNLKQIPKEQRQEVEDFLKNFEENFLPELVQSITKAINNGNLETIAAVKDEIETIVSRLDLEDLLHNNMNRLRRDDEGMMPNFLSMHYGGFGK